jgi:hypothetical protein
MPDICLYAWGLNVLKNSYFYVRIGLAIKNSMDKKAREKGKAKQGTRRSQGILFKVTRLCYAQWIILTQDSIMLRDLVKAMISFP